MAHDDEEEEEEAEAAYKKEEEEAATAPERGDAVSSPKVASFSFSFARKK